MKIGGIFSFNNGKEIIEAEYAAELHEIQTIIEAIDGQEHKTKVSAEKTMLAKCFISQVP